MGKKVKKRVDVFYKRAKIAGYRARSAYKLIQIENKYQILQGSRVCIDLCAAPGSWMQVAKQTMPVSSVIIGVDLYPIQPIYGTQTIIGDITTEKVRQELKQKLGTWKADTVLHDGAPNVGNNWLHDSYQQNLLTLHAFKLACEMLQKGGSFVTKVFRSKDYFKLEYVFKQLFNKVEATKPLSSRYESAEIFVICKGYLSPDKVDPDFFNPKSVFAEVDQETMTKVNILKPSKTKPKAEGYPEGATHLYNKVPVSDFIHASNFVEVLQDASELHFEDDEAIRKHKLTTANIIESCKDIKVLGRRELKELLKWRKAVKDDLDIIKQKKEELKKKLEGEEKKDEEEGEEIEDGDEELAKIEKELKDLKYEQAKDKKKALKKSAKMKKKLLEKMKLRSLVPGDQGPQEQSSELFNLEKLSKLQDIDSVVDKAATEVISDSEEEHVQYKKYERYARDKEETGDRLDRTGRFYMKPGDTEIDKKQKYDDTEDIMRENLGIDNDDNDINIDDASESEDDVDDVHNPLLTDLVGDTRTGKRARKASTWFNQEVFKGLDNNDEEEDFGLDYTIKKFEEKGGVIPKKDKSKLVKKTTTKDEGEESGYTSDTEVATDAPKGYTESDTDSDDSDSDTDFDSDSDDESRGKRHKKGSKTSKAANTTVSGLTNITNKKRKAEEGLDAVGLALASQMIHSKKAKRDIEDAAWNRYMFGDEDDLPDWFVKDEHKFNKLRTEVDPVDLRFYNDRNKSVNARTIKKVVQAKARKQRRMKKRMDKAKKKAEVITENAELSSREKAQEVNKLYKKAMEPFKKKEAQFVVMKRRNRGVKPKGVKGPYKMVDKRMKKDRNAEKKAKAKGKQAKGGKKPKTKRKFGK